MFEHGANPLALEALKAVSPAKLVEKAEEGSGDAVEALYTLSYHNPEAKKALRTIDPERFIEKASLNDFSSYQILQTLAMMGNQAAAEAEKRITIRTADEILMDDFMNKTTSYKKTLINVGTGTSTGDGLE